MINSPKKEFSSSLACKIIIVVIPICLIAAAFAIPVAIILTNTMTLLTKLTTVTTTTMSTTTAPPSSTCASTSGGRFDNNQFIYSPSQLYAAGMRNNQFAIYRAYSNLNVTSATIWSASQSSTSSTAYLALQLDGNLVVYTVSGNAVLWASGTNNGGVGRPFCFQLFDSGNLVWKNNASTIMWQTYSAQSG